MTIVHLFRRYERWNPVHPTYGAFWGFGIGLGCGVGWGPGFGPEAIGFVGSGCGIGFSVGVTLIGVGIGLPASGFTCLPLDATVNASNRVVKFTRSHYAPAMMNIMRHGQSLLDDIPQFGDVHFRLPLFSTAVDAAKHICNTFSAPLTQKVCSTILMPNNCAITARPDISSCKSKGDDNNSCASSGLCS